MLIEIAKIKIMRVVKCTSKSKKTETDRNSADLFSKQVQVSAYPFGFRPKTEKHETSAHH